jgi:hypothetical protein
MSGNLCRGGAYTNIVAAIVEVAGLSDARSRQGGAGERAGSDMREDNSTREDHGKSQGARA